jgi:hypothetical protein
MIEAMKAALKALDTCHWDYDYEEESYKTFDENLVNNAIEALRQAIEQAEKQEPVARFNWNEAKFEWLTEYNYEKHHMKPLYLTPPKREWVNLTDKEIFDTLDSYDEEVNARQIEALLKKKNT